MNLMKHGRKWLALAINVGVALLVLGMSFYLALDGKLTSEWSMLSGIIIGSVTAGVATFMGTNAYNTGKTIEATGEAPPEGGG